MSAGNAFRQHCVAMKVGGGTEKIQNNRRLTWAVVHLDVVLFCKN